MQTSLTTSTNEAGIEILRINDGRIDVGKDLELVGTTDVIAVRRCPVADNLSVVDITHLIRLKGLNHPLSRPSYESICPI